MAKIEKNKLRVQGLMEVPSSSAAIYMEMEDQSGQTHVLRFHPDDVDGVVAALQRVRDTLTGKRGPKKNNHFDLNVRVN